MHISSTGGFSAGYLASQEDQMLTLLNIDLVSAFSTDQQAIQDLITKNKLITD